MRQTLKKLLDAVIENIRMVFFSGEIDEFFDDDWEDDFVPVSGTEPLANIIPFPGTDTPAA